ncbi:GPI ethanolamine phosphate transferase 1 [Drosophila obscura]|uniref:GPI ethanolamine phosphate transferase 1 n=1 Tax=Drosophila obscura TaxID=7282 RepID=UPI001BB13F44|nr:GPI ethanolamine phosphate transferase 1 [Drosophila obscura]
MWELQALVVHILLLGCIIHIYFQSTIVAHLEPQKTLPELGLQPPADRLVVFIAHGLRAESFFSGNCSGVPHIQQLFEKQGIVGISSGLAPTMTRPGLIAMFAGFTEDPQTAITNFMWNPTPFDSVFNRSRIAIGWVPKTVADYFTRSRGEPPRFETDFAGGFKTDAWVYEKARNFLTSDENIRQLHNATQAVFLVYLSELDKVGHGFTPLRPEFRETLHATQQKIRKAYELFESAFNDSRTAYLMTSDHGMADMGFHGGGTDLEKEMPFFLWGAGVKRQGPHTGQSFTANAHGLQLPLQELNQIQLAPLMSALIGLPPPINNRAPLPLGYLNVSVEYERQSLLLNVLQLLSQARSVLLRHERSLFHKWLPKYGKLDAARTASLPTEVEQLMARGYVKTAVQLLLQTCWRARQCLDYYQDYYRTPLLVAMGASFLGWLFCLAVWLTRSFSDPDPDSNPQPKMGLQTWMTALMVLLGIALGCVLLLQRVPCMTAFYLLLPIGIWTMALAERPLHGRSIPYPLTHLAWTVIPAGLVVTTSFMNRHVGLLYAAVVVAYNRRGFRRPTLKFFLWLAAVLLPSGFLIVQQNYRFKLIPSEYILGFSMCLAVFLPWLLGHKHPMHVWLINSGILLIGIYGIYLRENTLQVALYLEVAFWAFLAYAFLSVPYSGADTPLSRLHLISFNLIVVHALLSLSAGSLFNQMLITEFLLGQHIHSEINKAKKKAIEEEPEPEPEASNGNENETLQKDVETLPTALDSLKLCYRYATFILLYFYVSFFGSGHWLFSFAFQPTTSRLLVSNSPPITMTALIILKILIPSIIIMSGVYTFSAYARKNSRAIFICMFLISDVMCLYFCFYVRNDGSWRDMRRSMDHVLLTNTLVILLLGCSCFIKSFLNCHQGP